MKHLVLKITSACCFILIFAASVSTAFAADELIINGEAQVKVGDTVTLTLNLADTDEKTAGLEMRLFYDADKLEYVKDSFAADELDGIFYNQEIEGQIPMNWSNISDPADFSSKSTFLTCDFTVKEAGEAEISFFVIEMYGESFFESTAVNSHIRSYTWTYDLTVNGENVVTDGILPISRDTETLEKHQSSFINYEDGKGELNSSLQGEDHKAVLGNTDGGAGLNSVEATEVVRDGTGGLTAGKLILIIGIPVFAVLIAAAVIFVVRSNKKS